MQHFGRLVRCTSVVSDAGAAQARKYTSFQYDMVRSGATVAEPASTRSGQGGRRQNVQRCQLHFDR